MITGQEIARALTGSWLLLKNRPEGMLWFDRSLEGFWRSFGVFFLLLPVVGITGLMERKMYLEETDLTVDIFPDGLFWTSQLAASFLDWILLPVVLAFLARSLGIARGYVDFVIVRNWSSLLVVVPYALAGLLYLAGIIPLGIVSLVIVSAFIAILWYKFNITRITLQTGTSMTVGIVVLDMVLSIVIEQAVVRMLG
ncbi:hypothetical protein [Roseibium sp.]|uniref:hypothetical protein n=1 Tax=Roseibium sp. TaxID=1936156 RepID=UPI003A970771